MEYLEELKELKLPANSYVVFGSGPLAIRGLRQNRDVDLIVNRDLWNKLVDKYGETEEGVIEIGNVDIRSQIIHLESVDKLIANAEFIEGVPYARLEDVIDFKKKIDRQKDREDISLILEYLSRSI